MRRRALCAASAVGGGGDDWSLELHFIAEWEMGGIDYETCYIWGDFSEVINKLKNMCLTLGVSDGSGYCSLYNIPIECNFTIDGERLTRIECTNFNEYIYVYFGDDCSGSMFDTLISLVKFIL